MWVILALVSASLLGLYDVFKKQSLKDNAVIPVLFFNTFFCALFFFPSLAGSLSGAIAEGSGWYIPEGSLHEHVLVMVKSVLVLSSWICGYFAIKRLPLTIVGPVNATRPVMTLIGAMLIFGERLNLLQWCGVITAAVSFWLLSRTGKKEGIDFKSNVWVLLLVAAAVLGAMSGLYDKYLMSASGAGLDRLFVQGWYNVYQLFIMSILMFVLWCPDRDRSPFRWRWTIPLISIALTSADLAYLYALTIPGAMISIVSMIRRCSVLVSFLFGAFVFHEKNIRSKAADLLLVLVSLVLLLAGTLTVSCTPKAEKMFEIGRTQASIDGLHAPWDGLDDDTAFRCCADDSLFRFSFRVNDSTLTLAPVWRDEYDVMDEDRVEIFFSQDTLLTAYYGAEMDPDGHVLDYRAEYYRKFDYSWNFRTLKFSGEHSGTHYSVSGSIALEELESLGLNLCGGFYMGVFRADFRGDGHVTWYSYVSTEDESPDFHKPDMFFPAKLCR